MEKEPLSPPLPPLNPPIVDALGMAPIAPVVSTVSSEFRKSVALRVLAILVLVLSVPGFFSMLSEPNFTQNFSLFMILPLIVPVSACFVLFTKDRLIYRIAGIVLVSAFVLAIVAIFLLISLLSGLRGASF